MQIKQFLLIVLLCTCSIFTNAQSSGTLSGIVKSKNGTALSDIQVHLKGTRWLASTDPSGRFSFPGISAGQYQLSVNAMGFQPHLQTVNLTANQSLNLTISLTEVPLQMKTVTVHGRSATHEVNRQAFNVTAIDASKLYNTTLDIAGALDRVAGVRVRESGGVGSNFNVSLNGFSGRHIRYFIDGIPMDNFGSSFQINNIPINLAERIEVYKGVVPMWLGSDALGGAINIVTANKQRNYLDASYAIGSFNTHRTVLNAAATAKNGLTLQLNAFQNYSDNNYKIGLKTLLQNNMEPDKRAAYVRRFHDTYHNETLVGNIGLVQKSWADLFLVGITLGKNYKEMQTAARPEAVYGQLHRRGTIVMPSLKFKKDNLLPGLDVTLNANYNLGYETTIDTARADYDWDGIRDPKLSMGETDGGQHIDYRNNNGLATAMLSYRLSERQSIGLNNVFSTFDRKSDNLLFPDRNALNVPKKMDKNVMGLGYSYDVKGKWSVNLFTKYISLKSVVNSFSQSKTDQKLGYGTAISYYINPNLQLRTSYELTNRMPEANEIFGNLENEAANPLLKPEKSNNLNLGATYTFQVEQDHRFSITANAIYRHSTDFIYSRLVGGTGTLRDYSISDNRDGVRTTGFDGELRYSFKNKLNIGGTLTYQMLRNLQKHDYNPNTKSYYPDESLVYLDQMPNIPYFFGNADASLTFQDVLATGNRLTIGYNLLYVHRFWLDWPSFGNKNETDKNAIPMQLSHDVNLVYSIKNGRYNLSVESRNLGNRPLFDNFALQKPGRSFNVNFRYFFSK